MAISTEPVGVRVDLMDVKFDLYSEGNWHTFRVSNDALLALDRYEARDIDRLVVFRRHKDRILNVAHTLVDMGLRSPEILIKREFFDSNPSLMFA